MSTQSRLTLLKYVMIGTGVIFAFGLYPLTQLWPSGWSWGVGHSHYQMMIVGVYGTLGLCLIYGAKDPMESRSLVWFTVWSSALHSVIMAFQALGDPAETGHLYGDVPALALVAIALGALTPRGARMSAVGGQTSRRAA